MEPFRAILVDDDESFLTTLVIGLELWARERGCEIKSFNAASEALLELERPGAPVALVLSDQRMPGLKGSELLRIVSDRHPETMTMLLTAHADLKNIAEAVQAGIFSFVPKPCTPEYLRGELDKALGVRELRREHADFISTMQEELRWGGELQSALLRLDLPSSPRVRFELRSCPLPLFKCGGDYHDAVITAGGDTLFMIGDVAGHGVRAAFVTFFLRAAIRQGYLAKTRSPSPSRLLSGLNDLICDELSALPDMLVTFFVCMLGASCGTLRYSNAGHLPAFLLRGGMATPFKVQGPALGFACKAEYADASLEMNPGDRIVLRTDGLREIGRDIVIGDEAFGKMLSGASASKDFNAAVLDSIRREAGETQFTDDATLLTATLL